MVRATPEGAVLKACLALLKLRGVFCFRNNTGAHKTAGRFIRYGKIGSSDIYAILEPHGRFLAVEVKRPRGKPTAAQRAFLDAVNTAGGLGVVVDDVKALDAILVRLRDDPGAKAGDLT